MAARADRRPRADDGVALRADLPTLARRRARRSRRWPLGPDRRRMDRRIDGSADVWTDDGARGGLEVRGLVVLRRGRGSRAHLGNGRGERSTLELHPALNRSSPATLSDHHRTHPKRGGGAEFLDATAPVRRPRGSVSSARVSDLSRDVFGNARPLRTGVKARGVVRVRLGVKRRRRPRSGNGCVPSVKIV